MSADALTSSLRLVSLGGEEVKVEIDPKFLTKQEQLPLKTLRWLVAQKYFRSRRVEERAPPLSSRDGDAAVARELRFADDAAAMPGLDALFSAPARLPDGGPSEE